MKMGPRRLNISFGGEAYMIETKIQGIGIEEV